MYVRVEREARASLADADNFRAFKLVTELPAAELGLALGASGAGSLADAGHVWIREQWLRAQGAGRGEGWSASLEEMLRFARSRGWTDAASASVRAHVERPAAAGPPAQES